jgi:alanine dehydrogenase
MVGKHAVEAGSKLGNIERNNDHIKRAGPGSIVWNVGRNVTGNIPLMQMLFSQADVLVDAAQRRDPSVALVPNDWIACLPEHAVIADLSVDPYLLSCDPPVVRGVEGVPMGNLDKYIYYPDDPDWDKTVPPQVNSTHRRVTTTCYSWPGIHPEACMHHYAQQLLPLMELLAARGYRGLRADGQYFERALHRATIDEWLRMHEF